jgi:hypothetical protein
VRGKLRVTLRLFDRSVTISTRSAVSSSVCSDQETLRAVADALRTELGSIDFPWERLIVALDPEHAWADAVTKSGE